MGRDDNGCPPNAGLEKAWNAGDGSAFAAPFGTETDFVDIRGEHHHGDRAVVARGHQAILDTIYRGSTISYDVDRARVVADDCVIAVVNATLDAPAGPLQGRHRSVITAVIVGNGDGWEIVAFHNTLVAGQP